MTRMPLVAALGALLSFNIASAPVLSIDRPTASRIDHLVKVSGAVGGIIGLAYQGKLIYAKPFGYRNLATHAAVDAQTRFEIGSVTKQFTAAAVLQLKEHRKLNLDDSLAKYLPSFPHSKEITLRQMLYQVSGLPDYVGMPNFDEQMRHGPGNVERIAAFASAPLDFKPGTKWEYSSTNYYLLGRILELVSHQSYNEYVKNNLFKPAGMSRSAFISDERMLDNFATPYWNGPHRDGPPQPAPATPESWAGGAGAIVSTVSDLAAWNTSLAAGKIVRSEDYSLMSSPSRLLDGHITDYGMGISIDTEEGHRSLWHNGATNGSVSLNNVYPNDSVDIIVLENSGDGDPGIIERAILEHVFPDALAIARAPAKGESPALRNRMLKNIEQILRGTLPLDKATPSFGRFWTAHRKAIAAYWAHFGPPAREIFKGARDDESTTWYLYRLEFAQDVRECSLQIDKKTGLIANINIHPPG